VPILRDSIQITIMRPGASFQEGESGGPRANGYSSGLMCFKPAKRLKSLSAE